VRFVVDETSWRFDGLDPAVCIEALEEMLDRVDDALLQGHGCCYSDDLFHIPVRDGRSFYELYDDRSPVPIPQNVRMRVAAAFARLQSWQDLDAPWPEDFYVAVAGGTTEYAPSIAWAHKQAMRGADLAPACISHPIRRANGRIDVTVLGATASVWFVSTARDAEHFFRWLILDGGAFSISVSKFGLRHRRV